jgi:hypothetical protein
MFKDTNNDFIRIEALDGGGFKLDCEKDDGTGWGTTYYGMVTYENMQNLEGKILTIIDASFQDTEQRKAVKDVFRRTFWFDWMEHYVYRGKCDYSVGMPIAG